MTGEAAAEPTTGDVAPRVVRRYANRKLYDTTERRFTSLSAIETLVREGVPVVIIDHRTGADVTDRTLRRVLSARQMSTGNRSLLVELIRSPSRIAQALNDGDRDEQELRELRDQVGALTSIIDDLLSRSDSAEDEPAPDEIDGGHSAAPPTEVSDAATAEPESTGSADPDATDAPES